jgi:hypothetical protein
MTTSRCPAGAERSAVGSSVISGDDQATTARVARLEGLAGTDVGRNVEPLVAAASGGLGSAAASFAAGELSVLILTGAFISWADQPAAETDGPPGAAMLGEFIQLIGGRALLLTDAPCAPVVAATAADAGLEVKVAGSAADVTPLVGDAAFTHVVSVERLGPAADGNTYFMSGERAETTGAKLERVLEDAAGRTIGIGDGGNELGMGSLTPDLIAKTVPHGEKIACRVGADDLIVSGISNWGAAALILAIGLSRPGALEAALQVATGDRHQHLVDLALEAGALDGVAGRSQRSVDGVDLETAGNLIDKMNSLTGDKS